MPADYYVTKADMDTVANAIKTKGGTTDPLVFPDGFKTAIENIPSGGGGGYTFDDVMSSVGSYTSTNLYLDFKHTYTSIYGSSATGKSRGYGDFIKGTDTTMFVDSLYGRSSLSEKEADMPARSAGDVTGQIWGKPVWLKSGKFIACGYRSGNEGYIPSNYATHRMSYVTGEFDNSKVTIHCPDIPAERAGGVWDNRLREYFIPVWMYFYDAVIQ